MRKETNFTSGLLFLLKIGLTHELQAQTQDNSKCSNRPQLDRTLGHSDYTITDAFLVRIVFRSFLFPDFWGLWLRGFGVGVKIWKLALFYGLCYDGCHR